MGDPDMLWGRAMRLKLTHEEIGIDEDSTWLQNMSSFACTTWSGGVQILSCTVSMCIQSDFCGESKWEVSPWIMPGQYLTVILNDLFSPLVTGFQHGENILSTILFRPVPHFFAFRFGTPGSRLCPKKDSIRCSVQWLLKTSAIFRQERVTFLEHLKMWRVSWQSAKYYTRAQDQKPEPAFHHISPTVSTHFCLSFLPGHMHSFWNHALFSEACNPHFSCPSDIVEFLKRVFEAYIDSLEFVDLTASSCQRF